MQRDFHCNPLPGLSTFYTIFGLVDIDGECVLVCECAKQHGNKMQYLE